MDTKRKILFIATLSPPITGSSVASERILRHLQKSADVTAISYSRPNLKSGTFSLLQSLRILGICFTLLKYQVIGRQFDHVYLVISSTFWGNLRDLFILWTLGKRHRGRTVVHRHGNRFLRSDISGKNPIRMVNKKFFGEIRAAIVLGESLRNIFQGYVPGTRVHIVQNFFNPDVLIPQDELEQKWKIPDKVEILFLSNLIKEKGYTILLDVISSISPELRSKCVVHFAGQFYSDAEEAEFKKKIAPYPNIFFHGVVREAKKRDLLWRAHLFCLPTMYKFEGQPISMLEAYVAGCVVLTTPNGGIMDVFQDQRNGYFVGRLPSDGNFDVGDLRRGIESAITDLIIGTGERGIAKFREIAILNRIEAQKRYSEELYCQKLEKVIIAAT